MGLGEILVTDNGAISNLGDARGRITKKGFCENPTGTIVWNLTSLTDVCPYEKLGAFNAQVQGFHLIIEKLQGAFVLKSKYGHATFETVT